MKVNPLKAGLAAGRVQIGSWINIVRNPAALPLYRSAGLDYGRLDLEHGSLSMETVADMAVVSRALDFPLVVRPPEGNREWITRLLDAGIWCLHVPGIETPEIAHEIVQASRYYPVGMRGRSSLGPQHDFDPDSAKISSLPFHNEQVHIAVMFESLEAFRHLDEIVGMEGIDAVAVGASDLSQELGVMGKPEQEQVIDEYRNRLIDAAKRHGKDVAMLVNTVDEAVRWIKAGVKIIAYSSDVNVLRSGYAQAVTRMRGES
jgi:2-keto-3-deoxy-L-rhamnonate aldolase RhmA